MYKTASIAFGLSLLATFAYPQEIDKPTLHDNLDYLHDGLYNNLRTVAHTLNEWVEEWIPQFCLDESKDDEHGFNLADMKAYDIKFDDCEAPWIVCNHKDSDVSIETLADSIGRIPVGSRSYVRHILALPGAGDGVAGTNGGDNIVFFDIGDNLLPALIHEVAHSTDSHAYDEKLSESDDWKYKVSLDSAFPNDYAKSSPAEDVAESSILATYNIVVPGGYPGIEPRWEEVRNQYETVQTWQREKADNIMTPGGQCQNRLENSEAVPRPTGKRLLRGRWAPWRRSEKPDTSLPQGLGVIEPVDFNSGKCVRGHRA
ncbi:MAG: hypothetical protein LQ337_002537 [Flavoplaca oasis]|nr:MAG: hypothetical protein LQ337_002537 [Flavoplaca oasis]